MKNTLLFFISLTLAGFYNVLPTMHIIAHRGASGTHPENTLGSFSKALEVGAYMIEFDVHVCKSGEVVIIHDETVDRTTNGTGYVAEKTLQELKSLQIITARKISSDTLSNNAQKIPTLEEALDLIKSRALVNIELKGAGTAAPVAEIITRYIKDKGWQFNDFLISSFDHHALKKIKTLLPEVKIAPLICSHPLDYAACASTLQSYSIHVCIENCSAEMVNDAHARGLKIYAYTVNDERNLKKALEFGVDGIFTDFPEIMYKLLSCF